MKYILEKKAVEKGFMFTNKAGKSRIKSIEIEIPYKIEGKKSIPDFEKQKKLAEKYEQLYAIKDRLIQSLQGLQEIRISI